MHAVISLSAPAHRYCRRSWEGWSRCTMICCRSRALGTLVHISSAWRGAKHPREKRRPSNDRERECELIFLQDVRSGAKTA